MHISKMKSMTHFASYFLNITKIPSSSIKTQYSSSLLLRTYANNRAQ